MTAGITGLKHPDANIAVRKNFSFHNDYHE